MNTYLWLLRREFWENRAIWVVPAILGGLLLLTALFGRGDILVIDTPPRGHIPGGIFLFAFGAAFFVVMSIYSTWYLLDCLYADRKDRSILFWKSLPISDTATVMSKLITAFIVIPFVYFAAADLTTLLMAFIISVRARGFVGASLWQPDVWLQLQVMWLYLIVTTAVWFLPFAGWLLTVSAWAKRAVMLWSILPLLALYWGESWIFGTHVVAGQIGQRLMGYVPLAFHKSPQGEFWVTRAFGSDRDPAGSVWTLLNPAGFFASPQTWIGVAVGIALILCAIQLRLRRTEI